MPLRRATRFSAAERSRPAASAGLPFARYSWLLLARQQLRMHVRPIDCLAPGDLVELPADNHAERLPLKSVCPAGFDSSLALQGGVQGLQGKFENRIS